MIEPRQQVSQMHPYHLPDVTANIILSGNESPYNIPGVVIEEIKKVVEQVTYNRYPDPLSIELRTKIGEVYGLTADNVFVGNGGDEVILDLFLAYGCAGRKAITFDPMFEIYGITGAMTGTEMVSISRSPVDFLADTVLDQAYGTDASLIFLCCPNNPTGDVVPLEDIEKLLQNTEALVVIDEAYAEFSGQTAVSLLARYENLAILRTFSKAYSLAGLRAGYLLAGVGIIENMLKVKLFYNFNRLSQEIAKIALKHQDLFDEKIKVICDERVRIFEKMQKIDGVTPYPSRANFILFAVDRPVDTVFRGFADKDILIRNCSKQPLLEKCLRVSIGTSEENDAFLSALRSIMAE